MTNKQWKELFTKAFNDITSDEPTGDAINDLWIVAEREDPLQDNFELRTAMYLLFAYEKDPSLNGIDPSFFPAALQKLFPEV